MVSGTLKITEPGEKPLKYPKSVAYIISNEFCERFNYYGLRTILVLYLTSKLQYDNDTSTVLFHIFTMMVYLCPLVGAVVADSWLGKFRTILYLSIVYAIGGVIVSLGAVPIVKLPREHVTIVGLVLIAIGTGGIKPCVSAFGGDQFKLPEQTKQLATFFSLFYFAINAGSVISTSLTPILREDVHCFGDKDCFSLAFGVPALLMLISVVIFVAGKRLYAMKPPAGNMIFGVAQCIVKAVGGWRRNRKLERRDHWLDYAEPAVGRKLVEETKTLLKILVLFLPFPIFWALFDQQGSRWTFQATRMDGEIFGFTVKPDQMQVINPFLILGFIPLFDYVLYPILDTCGIRRPLQKLTLGGLLAATAFLLSAFVELKLERVEPKLPGNMTSQLRIYNGMPCRYRFDTDLPMPNFKNETHLTSLGLWEEKNITASQMMSYKFNANAVDAACPGISGELNITPEKAVSYFIAEDRLHEFEDNPEKPKLGNPVIRVLLNVPRLQGNFSLTDSADVTTPVEVLNATQVITVARGEVILTCNDLPVVNVTARSGGAYVILTQGNMRDGFKSEVHIVTQPNSVHIMWQLPQIIVITAAEIMFSITGLEFSFTQAPQSMKSVLQACWLLSVAIGNMLVVVVAKAKFFESQAAEFTLFASLMVVDMFVFMLLAMNYKYVEPVQDVEEGDKSESKMNPSVPLTTSKMPPSVKPHQAYTVLSSQEQERPSTSLPANSNLSPNLLVASPEQTTRRFSLASMFSTNNRRRSTQNGVTNPAYDNNEKPNSQ